MRVIQKGAAVIFFLLELGASSFSLPPFKKVIAVALFAAGICAAVILVREGRQGKKEAEEIRRHREQHRVSIETKLDQIAELLEVQSNTVGQAMVRRIGGPVYFDPHFPDDFTSLIEPTRT